MGRRASRSALAVVAFDAGQEVVAFGQFAQGRVDGRHVGRAAAAARQIGLSSTSTVWSNSPGVAPSEDA